MASKKRKSVFICSECQAEFPHWSGRCAACNAWNSINEGAATTRSPRASEPVVGAELMALRDVPPEGDARLKTGVADLDLVLGGGIVPGSFVLIAGEPGVGKSTLILELARHFKGKLYYFSGEESQAQVGMRARRLGLAGEELFLSRETELEAVCARIRKERPALAVIDSIQTLRPSTTSTPGGAAGLRDTALALMEVAKETRLPILVTGHVTKDGSVAGPRMMEHMTDVVLYFESDRLNHYRLLRAVKNRFGPVGETAIFEMTGNGLTPVATIEPQTGMAAPGRVYSAFLEGSRALGVEVQALVTRTQFGQTRRMAEGLDNRRLILMAAVLEKYLKLRLSECDVFANLAGGLDSDDPALDLAICAALLSSYRDEPGPSRAAFLGEVGLSGEIRPVARIGPRIKELTALGFELFFVSEADSSAAETGEIPDHVRLKGVPHVSDLARNRAPANNAPPPEATPAF